jgi:hypothetical protein
MIELDNNIIAIIAFSSGVHIIDRIKKQLLRNIHLGLNIEAFTEIKFENNIKRAAIIKNFNNIYLIDLADF